MALAGSKFEELYEILLAAYRDRGRLERLVLFELDKNLDEIVSGLGLEDTVFELIKWADAKGTLGRLINSAYHQNTHNKRLAAIYERLPAWLDEPETPSDPQPRSPPAATAEVAAPEPKQQLLPPSSLRPVVADLEIGLERGSDGYAVELRLALADGEAELRTKGDELRIEMGELERLQLDPLAYGLQLGQDLFRVSIVPQIFAMARAMEDPIRVRLFIDRSVEELNTLRWETLIDPSAPEPLAPLIMGERIQFSRYVSSADWRRVPPRPKGDLRALVVVANPSNLAEYSLFPLDVTAEFAQTRSSLDGIHVTTCGESDRASLHNIIAKLREDVDIFYLVCQGALVEGQLQLWLEDETGAAAVTSGVELAVRMRDLYRQPRLAILHSCKTAGDVGGSASFGRMLCEAAVPAVVGMQGQVTFTTVHAFMPVFFRELQRDGQIDRAVAVARGAIRDRGDAWSPVLYMRLRNGQLWQPTGP